MNIAHNLFYAALLPTGWVLATGGSTAPGIYTAVSELYDPLAGTWTTNGVGAMNYADYGCIGSQLPNGTVLVAGGNGPGSTAELFVITPGIAVPLPIVSLIEAVIPTFSNLSVGTDYQLQVSSDLNTWTNQGSPFTAINTNMIYPQYFQVDYWEQLFFRLQTAP